MQQEYVSIGIIGKPHGTSGAFRFKLTSPLLDNANLPQTLFIKTREGLLPFFVEDWSLRNSRQGNISFEDTHSREQGSALINAELFVKAGDFHKYFKEEGHNKWLNYMVVDVAAGKLGVIVEVTDNTVQEVAVVNHGDHQIMFPLIDEFIIEINADEKQLFVKLPDGLIEIYTTNTDNEEKDDG